MLIKNPLNLLFAHLEILDFPAIIILSYRRPNRSNTAAIVAVAVDFFNIYFQLEIPTTQLQSDA